MANPQHVAWLQEGVRSWNSRRKREPFAPDLSSEDISRVLGGHEREDIREISVHLSGVNLSGANLTDSTLRDTDLTSASLAMANLTRAKFAGSDFTGAQFIGGTALGAKFYSAKFDKTLFIDFNLKGAQFNGSSLRDTRFVGCLLDQAHLYNEELSSVDFILSRPWSALLYWPSSDMGDDSDYFNSNEIEGISELLEKCRAFREAHGDDIVLYFRGESRPFPELRPSVMRRPELGEATLRSLEGAMLDDLMTRQPEAFSGLGSALAQWVVAQHHGLRTRLLDITRNPLVALYNACDEHRSENGRLHVFGVPRSLIKPFNSDTVSVLANFAKLSRAEQNILLGKVRTDAPEDDAPPDFTEFLMGSDPFVKARNQLYTTIRQDKPYFEERMDVRDLYRVIVVEPQRSFERVRAQAGAFLLSAFHERYERAEVLRWNPHIPIYSHTVLNVAQAEKDSVLRDLRLLNVTRETLWPSVDEAARAVTQQYLNRSD